ncbi:translation initiation factor eIF4A [Haplosporangium sp. Z 767]|nr:translation initiation factor eIF4A [Haplosporangium sp. Z 767]
MSETIKSSHVASQPEGKEASTSSLGSPKMQSKQQQQQQSAMNVTDNKNISATTVTTTSNKSSAPNNLSSESSTHNNTSIPASARVGSNASSNSPKPNKSKRNNNGGAQGAPKSPKLSENEKKPSGAGGEGRNTAQPSNAARPESIVGSNIGLGMTPGGSDTASANGSNSGASNKQDQTQQPQQPPSDRDKDRDKDKDRSQPSLHQSNNPNRRGGRFDGERQSNPSHGSPLSTSTSPSTSASRFANSKGGPGSRGRDEENIRGRKLERKSNRGGSTSSPSNAKKSAAKTESKAGESSPSSITVNAVEPAAADATKDANTSVSGSNQTFAPASTVYPTQLLDSQRVSKVNRIQQDIRSPRSPRRESPERGNGTRNSNAAQESPSPSGIKGAEGAADSSEISKEDKDRADPGSPASQKKRKPVRKNKKRDEDESSISPQKHNGDISSESKESKMPGAQSDKRSTTTPAATAITGSGIEHVSNANVEPLSQSSSLTPKSKSNRHAFHEIGASSPRNKKDASYNPRNNQGQKSGPEARRTQQQSGWESTGQDSTDANWKSTTSGTTAKDTSSSGAKSEATTNSGWETPAPAWEDVTIGWGEVGTSAVKWGEEIPLEGQRSKPLTTPERNKGIDTGNNVQTGRGKTGSNSGNIRHGYDSRDRTMTGADRGRPFTSGSSDARFESSTQRQGYQRGVGSGIQNIRGTRKFQDADSAVSPRDARSSLDARNARLGTQRGPRLSVAGKSTQEDSRSGGQRNELRVPESTEADNLAAASSDHPIERKRPLGAPSTSSISGSSDVRLDARYNSNQMDSTFTSQRQSSQPSSTVSSDVHPRGSHARQSGFDSPGQHGRKGVKTKEPRQSKASHPPPLFSNSLECQMTWEEMGLMPNVLSSIAKAGLKRPSNIQKLVMKPFTEGKDVIAQTQSQKDRTNTLAIALLQKLSATASTQKHCQALLVCSEGINPQRVHEDLQVWFEATPGLKSILLSSGNVGDRSSNDDSDGSEAPMDKQQQHHSVLSDATQAKQVVITTLGPLMEVLKHDLLNMEAVETVVISMRSDELVNLDAFKQFWAILPRDAQVVLMTGKIQPQIQMIKAHHFRADAAVRRADELTLQWSEHYFVNISPQQHKQQKHEHIEDKDHGEGEESSDQEPAAVIQKDHKWEVLMEILGKNPEISHIVILTPSQSLTQALTTKLEEQKLPVLSVWSMADKTEVARQFNRPERCILVSESILTDNLDLDHSSLVINYEMPKRPWQYISSFGPFGRSGLRTLMINFCVTEDPIQKQMLENLESLYDIKVQEMKVL